MPEGHVYTPLSTGSSPRNGLLEKLKTSFSGSPSCKHISDFMSPGQSSTAASESDFRLPPDFSGGREHQLCAIKEQRGWKHFFKTVVAVPLAFVAGLLLGVLITVAAFMGVGGSDSSSSAFLQPTPFEVQAPYTPRQAAYTPVPPPLTVPEEYMTAQPLNNSCLIKELVIPEGPQTFDAAAFVIKSTDEVWNLRGDVEAAIEKYFHEDYIDAGSWGRRIVGKKALREAVLSEMRAFPDIKIHITDCVCKGNDIDGYKCAMPDLLTGTNTGPSGYGPATGRFARWTGMVESLVKKNPKTGQWQYYAEWGVHDEWSLIQQLGLDFASVPHPATNNEPIHTCTPLVRFGPEPAYDKQDLADQEQHAA